MIVTKFGKVAARDEGPDSSWYRNRNYDPPFLLVIDEQDHEILTAWHEETQLAWPNAGASGVEMMTMLTGLIMSAGISRVVQCGHYVGYSTLILGFIARKMDRKRFLYSVDLDPTPSAYTQSWIGRSKLEDIVKIGVGDSSDPAKLSEAIEFLGGLPQLVYIDSSHQYEHTLMELNLWWDALPPGGLIVMDDVSQWAAEFDRTGLGGSHRAALEFCKTKGANSVLLNADFGRTTGSAPIYTDICGFGLIQKPH